MKKIAIIGCNSHQLPLISKAKEMGYQTHVFAWQVGDVGEKTADFYYPISVADKQAILKECKKIIPDGVVSIASDLSAITACYVACELGIPGNSKETVFKSTNKVAFRECMKKAGINQPAFAAVGDVYPVSEIKKLKFPIVVKPSDRSGNRSVLRADNTAELLRAIIPAKEASFDRKAIAEEYTWGEYYSAECISLESDHRVLALTRRECVEYDGKFLDYKRIQGGDIALTDQIKSAVISVLNALGVTSGASSVEFIIDKEGRINIIEAMLSMYGDFVGTHLVPAVYGFDYLGAVIEIACGGKPDLKVANVPSQNLTTAGFVLSKKDYRILSKGEKDGRLIASSKFDEADNISENMTGISYGYYILREQ